ncbi:MAG TPA: TatD family nuclease-associated radical SAM protein [Bacillota bacterium]|nr:TatD family nuclease-associated radical SAM protein [Bacillota bacterium]
MSNQNTIAQEDVLTYTLGEKLYLNITNKCSNRCEFCVRETASGVKEGSLWLNEEPTAQQVLEDIENPQQYEEIVFCGFGEPLSRVDAVVELATALRKYGVPLRINTNGQANLIHGYNVVPRLGGLIDCISISLNAENPEKYQKICNSKFGLSAYQAVLDFTALCIGVIPRVVLTVVERDDISIEACRKLALELGAEFRVRTWNPVL